MAVKYRAEGANRFCCSVASLACSLAFTSVICGTWSFLHCSICMLQCNTEIFHVTYNLNVACDLHSKYIHRTVLLAYIPWMQISTLWDVYL